MDRVEILSQTTRFFSFVNFFQLIFLSFITFYYSRKKDTGVLLAIFGILLSAFFFLGNGIFSERIFRGEFLIGNIEIYFTLFSIFTLPFIWTLICFWFMEKDRILGKKSLILGVMHILFLLFSFYFWPYSLETKQTLVDYFYKTPQFIYLIGILYIIFLLVISTFTVLQKNKLEKIFQEITKRNSYIYVKKISLYLLGLCFWILFFIILLKSRWTFSKIYTHFSEIEILSIFNFTCTIFLVFVLREFYRAVIQYEIFNGNYLPRNLLKNDWNLCSNYSFLISLPLFFGTTEFSLLAIYFYSTILGAFFLAYTIGPFGNAKQKIGKELFSIFKPDELFSALFSGKEYNSYQKKIFDLLHQVSGCESFYLQVEIFPGIQPVQFPPNSAISFTPNFPDKREYSVLQRDDWKIYIPLFLEKKRTGFVLLGKKEISSFYSEEEVEMVRFYCELFLESITLIEIFQLLWSEEKRRILSERLEDVQLRRVLHDEILPDIHSLLLNDSKKSKLQNKNLLLQKIHKKISTALKNFTRTNFSYYGKDILTAIEGLAQREYADQKVNIQITGNRELLKNIPETGSEILFHALSELLRNSKKYALSNRENLEIHIILNIDFNLEIIYSDNGNWKKNSTQESSGLGLFLHSTLLAIIGGKLERTSDISKSEFRILFPV